MSELLKRIVVGIDGSEAAGNATELALRLARAHEGEVIFAYAIDYAAASEHRASVIEALTEDGRTILHNAKSRAVEAGVAARTELLEGRSEYALTRYAAEVHADAMAVGASGGSPSERFFLGSTTEGILRLALMPVFVVREYAVPPSDLFKRIVVAIDNSDPSDAAIQFATKLGTADGGNVAFCHVIDDNTLYEEAANYGGATYPVLHEWLDETTALSRAAAEQAGGAGIRSIETAVLTGNPVKEILNFAAAQAADLIVVGAHGRRGLRHLLMGSVAHGIVRRSNIPVVVVRTAVAAGTNPRGNGESQGEIRPHVDQHGYVTLRSDD